MYAPPPVRRAGRALPRDRHWRKTENTVQATENCHTVFHQHTHKVELQEQKVIAKECKILYNAIWVQVILLCGRVRACAGRGERQLSTAAYGPSVSPIVK